MPVRRVPSDESLTGISASERLNEDEGRFIRRSLSLALLLPILLAISVPLLSPLVGILAKAAIYVFLPLYVVIRLLYQWSQRGESLLEILSEDLRPGIPGAPVDVGLPRAGWPIATVAVILLNAVVHYTGADPELLAFDIADPRSWLWSNFTALFAHADGWHLWGNMFFLWIFGSAVEGRVGRRRYVMSYLIAGTAGHLATMLGCSITGDTAIMTLGSSGAVSGILGVFMVRCHFSRVSIGVPLLGVAGAAFPIVFRVRLNAMLLMALFFLATLAGAGDSLERVGAEINHWSHLGGYFVGLALAYAGGLLRAGIRESLEVRAFGPVDTADSGRSRGAVEMLLRLDADCVDAILARARDESACGPTPSSKADYHRAVSLLLRADRARAAVVFAESFRESSWSLPLAGQLNLTPALAAIERRGIAAHALELAVMEDRTDPSLVAKALLYQARLCHEMGRREAAARICEQILSEHSESAEAQAARWRLERLR